MNTDPDPVARRALSRSTTGDESLAATGAVPCGEDRDGVDRAAATVGAIVAAGAPVYGVNTGFGLLANKRIEPGDLAQLQRNIVLSHAAGVGAPLAASLVRLIMALKIAALSRGASGVRWELIALAWRVP